jgi:hypothetical protein
MFRFCESKLKSKTFDDLVTLRLEINKMAAESVIDRDEYNRKWERFCELRSSMSQEELALVDHTLETIQREAIRRYTGREIPKYQYAESPKRFADTTRVQRTDDKVGERGAQRTAEDAIPRRVRQTDEEVSVRGVRRSSIVPDFFDRRLRQTSGIAPADDVYSLDV